MEQLGLDPRQVQKVVTPVRCDQLEKMLHGYPGDKLSFLLNGFKYGFQIPFSGTISGNICKNLKSARDNIEVVKQKIQVEIDAGRVAGPFAEKPFPDMQISPLGLVPKKELGQWRIIHHLSFPKGFSINDGIPVENSTVQYQNIDHAVKLIQKCGPGAFMCKTDIENAYRIVPISPDDHKLLGFAIDGQFFYDKNLAMGLSASCNLFEKFSTALHWIAEEKLGVSGCAHVLDDFFLVAPSFLKAKLDLDNFLEMARKLGVPIKDSKTVPPCTIISFVGIELDSVAMEKRLPQDKLDKVRSQLNSFLKRKKATLQELQSLIGLLSFACSVVSPGRAFLRRLIDLTVGLNQPHYRRRLNKEAKADLAAWSQFIENFNGKSLFLADKWLNSTDLNLFTDASNAGFGGYWGHRWFAHGWPSAFQSHHINVKELFPIVIAVELWANEWENKCILFHTDNLSVVHVINKQSSKDKVIMQLLRRLVVKCLKHNILFQAEHVPGLENSLADQLSRLKISEFLQVFPAMNPEVMHIPKEMLQL